MGLTRASRLIRFRAPKTSSVLIESPDVDASSALLQTGKELQIRGYHEDDEGNRRLPLNLPSSTLIADRLEADLGTILRGLMRKANTEFLDRGLSTLYLAFGLLHWRDVDGSDMCSPLILVPITLIPEGPKGLPRVQLGEGDSVINPALTLRLREFDIKLPELNDLDGTAFSSILGTIAETLKVSSDFKSARLTQDIYLSMFSFAKEAMFRDLESNDASISSHPIVRALATSDPTQQTPEFQFDPIDPSMVDEMAPPESTPMVLDADSSQRIAIAAALQGKSFVMDGPPGSGKSQTIANMIAALMNAGKSVLFVSEKMAALDVVRNRLAEVGLGHYLLELHSHKTSRREVATELLHSLDNIVRPRVAVDAHWRHEAKQHRLRLNDYARAMNEVRTPLGRSLHTVLGRLSELEASPLAPSAEGALGTLSDEGYAVVRAAAARLSRAWRPAAQGTSYLWRNVTDQAPLEIRLQRAESALQQLTSLRDISRPMAEAFKLTTLPDTPRLIELADLGNRIQEAAVPRDWLACDDWASRRSLAQQLTAAVTAARIEVQGCLEETSRNWTDIPTEEELPPPPFTVVIKPRALSWEDWTAEQLDQVSSSFAAQSSMLREELDRVQSFASLLDLPAVGTFEDAKNVLRLVQLAGAEALPDVAWFAPGRVEYVQAAIRELATALEHREASAESAGTTYNASALGAPLAELQDRFSNLHKGLRKLSGRYRADKRLIADLVAQGTSVQAGISELTKAVAWQTAEATLQEAIAQHSAALESFWRGPDTNFAAARAAVDVAVEALQICGGEAPSKLVSYLTAGGSEAHREIARSTSSTLEKWERELQATSSRTASPELLLHPVTNAAQWLQAHVEPMAETARYLRTFHPPSYQGRMDGLIAQAHRRSREKAAHALEELAAMEAGLGTALADLPRGLETDLEQLQRWVELTDTVRQFNVGPLTTEQIAVLQRPQSASGLAAAYAQWLESEESLVQAFAPERHPDLREDFSTAESAAELIQELRSDATGQSEWFEHGAATNELSSLGLAAAVDYCRWQRVPAQRVPDVLEKALLRAWVDATIQADTRLQPLLAKDRDALVEAFRDIDRQLVEKAVGEIVTSANARRPQNTAIGESAVIRREGAKQRRHIPVRDLVSRAQNAVQAIKPVFMMSPLAVSQYLPSDIKFDVVIFDEASQVTPGDAINCIYRGNALILAGDERQLPPTAFFERMDNGDEDNPDTDVQDFQSILELAKASGAFNNLGLRWHYRSRHEDLIAFSNYKFYDGKLITFPSAQQTDSSLGVEFFHADGVYQRGGGAHNPVEARKVADRVLHHFDTRPDQSLGVVTFSVAQAEAVQTALDAAREERRDLDHHFDTTDRLDGFFIRSLESVQGDERDVIIFSVGYGPDEAGKVTTNFGVLNRDKGWRRLNVGATRARRRVEVVASMRAGEIPPSHNENVEYFRAYLEYAERGQSTLAIAASSTGLEPESPFEESVLSVIRSWGYTAEAQVGAAGYRIDIAVRHPEMTGMFMLGVECDGYQYHSAPAARDRDRLRDQVLAGLGWNMHRIWGTAWYRDRALEEERLRGVLAQAISSPRAQPPKHHSRVETAVETVASLSAGEPHWVSKYEEAPLQLLPYWLAPDADEAPQLMAPAIKALVETEAPIHMDKVYERVRLWWDIGRIGARIRENIDRAVHMAGVNREDSFLMNGSVNRIRVHGDRRAEHVHLAELSLAVALTVRDAGAIDRSEVVQYLSRLFGWQRTGHHIEQRLQDAIEGAIRAGLVRGDGGSLTIGTPPQDIQRNE